MKEYFLSFIANQNRFSKDHEDYRYVFMINAVLLVMILFFLVFTILDIFLFRLYLSAAVNGASFLISCFLLYNFHKTDQVRQVAKYTVFVLFVSILLVIYQLSPNNHIFYWMVTLPPVAFFLLGRRAGYMISVLFGLLIATFYFVEHSNWDRDTFGLAGAFNVSLAYLGLVLSIGFYESSRQEAVENMQKDIERRKLAEQALKENELRLQHLNATKDKFFSIIAHDLRSPFNSIIGLCMLLEDQIESREYNRVAEYAYHIKSDSEKAMNLLTNLLEWARIQTGKIPLKPEYFNVEDSINQVVDLFDNALMQKKITVSKEYFTRGNLYADRDMISTVVRNLISNAIKYTPRGGAIAIVSRQTAEEQLFAVRDNGVGISEKNIDHLFKIDQSHSTPGTQNEKGTGLGLLLCKEFIEKHGGKIWVESQFNEGSTFSFSIPM